MERRQTKSLLAFLPVGRNSSLGNIGQPGGPAHRLSTRARSVKIREKVRRGDRGSESYAEGGKDKSWEERSWKTLGVTHERES